MTINRLSYKAFINRYKPILNHLNPDAGFDGLMFDTSGQELSHVNEIEPARIWTLIEGKDGFLRIHNGLHKGNRFGYFISEIPYEDKGNVEISLMASHWDKAEEYADQLLARSTSRQEKTYILEVCTACSIIAAGVCYFLMRQAKEAVASDLINRMIKNSSS